MPKLSDQEIKKRLGPLEGWERKGEAISKTYTFETFPGGIEFINRIADIAEQVDHHPDIDIRYRRVTFTIWTHSEGGITEKDFDLANRIEEGFTARKG